MTTILVVDDSQVDRHLLVAIFGRLSYRVLSAENGASALRLAKGEPVDVVLSDVLMPVMDGFELCRRLKQDPSLRGIRFIFYSATYTKPEEEAFAMELGADKYLRKPAEPETLVQAVTEVMSAEPRGNAPAFPDDELNYLLRRDAVISSKLEQKTEELLEESTALALTEAGLQALQARHSRLFQAMTDAYAEVDMAGRIVDFNPAFQQMLGYSASELRDLTFLDLTPVEWHDAEQMIIEHQVLPLGGSTPYEKAYRRKDGTSFPVELRTFLIRDGLGRPDGMWAIVQDITERKMAEQTLMQEKGKLQTLIQTIPDLLWFKDLDGTYQCCNPRFEALWGISEAYILGKTGYDFLPKELADNHKESDQLAIETDRPIRFEEWATFASDGHRELHDIIKTLVKDASGAPIGVLGLARDVTQNRADQERLNKLSKALEHSPVAVVMTDCYGVVEYVNPSYTSYTGYTLEEALGSPPPILKPGTTPPEAYRELWATIMDGRIWQGELQNRRKNGEQYWESISIAPIFDTNGAVSHFVAIKEDITHLKRIQSELQEQLSELRRWHEATLGREVRILDLKREVNELLDRLGEAPRYHSVVDGDGTATTP